MRAKHNLCEWCTFVPTKHLVAHNLPSNTPCQLANKISRSTAVCIHHYYASFPIHLLLRVIRAAHSPRPHLTSPPAHRTSSPTMSSTALPISPTRFATALKDLPLGSLYAKAFELRNALSHLRNSNAQLAAFASHGTADYDADCALALAENGETMARFEGRIAMLRREVEGRGMLWVGEENGTAVAAMDVEPGESAAQDGMETVTPSDDGVATLQQQQWQRTENVILTDEELRRLLEERTQQQQRQRTGNGRLTDEELRSRVGERMQEDDDADAADGHGGLHL